MKRIFLTDQQVQVLLQAVEMTGDIWAGARDDLLESEDRGDWEMAVRTDENLDTLNGVEALLKSVQDPA